MIRGWLVLGALGVLAAGAGATQRTGQGTGQETGTDGGMVLVPAGPAILGGADTLGLDGPRAYDVAAFLIDRFEVTNADYAGYVAAIGAPPQAFPDDDDLNAPDQPVTGVTWVQAENYCRWAGKRLPREIEWEKAARGVDGRAYPWGGEIDPGAALVGAEVPVAVQSYPRDTSPYGVRGMAGNVSEWVADTRIAEAGVCGAPHAHGEASAASGPYDPGLAYLARLSALGDIPIDLCRNTDIPTRFNPVEPCAFIKGNSFAGLPHMTRADNRMWDYTNVIADFVGFRCARDVAG